jgi:hypothetical protein
MLSGHPFFVLPHRFQEFAAFSLLRPASMSNLGMAEKAQEDVLEIHQDFGRDYGKSTFQPAVPRGKQDGNTVRPLVWGEEQKRIPLPRSEIAAAKKDRSDSGTISYTCVSPDKTRLAAAYGELVSIYSLPDWQSLITLQHDVAIDYIAFSPDSKSIVTSTIRSNTYELWVWDIESEVQRNKNLLGQQIQRANM